jgi:hypothetical protein
MAMLEDSGADPVEQIGLTEDARLLTSADTPIFDQLDLPQDVERIEIVSPFVDGKLEALLAMRARWPGAHIRLRMDPAFGALSDSLLELVGNRMTVLVPAEQNEDNGRRHPVHGKLLCFVGKRKATVVLGSANLSRPALLTTENFEAVVERRTRPEAVDALLKIPRVRWRKAKADDRRWFRPVPPPRVAGVVIASLHFRKLGVTWAALHGGTGVAKICCRGRCIAEKPFEVATVSGGRRALEWELDDEVREVFTDPCYVELTLREGRVLRGWIEVADRLGMALEAKRQLVFLDAIASDPLNCNEMDVVKFIELLQRRLEFASRSHAAAAGSTARPLSGKPDYDDALVARLVLLETGTNDFGQSLMLEHLVNRSLDAALRDLRFFGRDRGEQTPVGKKTAATAEGAGEDDESATMTQQRVPLRIEAVLMQLFAQLADAFAAAESPQTVASLIAQIPTCIKGLAYAAERWLSPHERHDFLHRYFHQPVVACLAPGIASIVRQNGAVRRLSPEARKSIQGGPEFELGLAILEAYLLLDHMAQPGWASSHTRDLYDMLREMPVPSSESIKAAGEEVKRLLPLNGGRETVTVESLRAAIEAVTGELAELRRSRSALRKLVEAIQRGVRDPDTLRPLAEAATGISAEKTVKAMSRSGRRLRLLEVSHEKAVCPVCYTRLPLAAQARLNDASHVERCSCGMFVVRSLEQ